MGPSGVPGYNPAAAAGWAAYPPLGETPGMHVFIYEFFTGGGLHHFDHSDVPTESLIREGRAMATALATDFAALPDVSVAALRDSRIPSFDLLGCELHDVYDREEEKQWIAELASQSDWTVMIAPEFDGLLLDRCRLVEDHGGRLLSPGTDLVGWASDKRETCRRWREAGVPVPRSCLLNRDETPSSDFPFPAVLKPCDGAGSLSVQRIGHATDLRSAAWPNEPMRLEQFCHGTPCSIGIIGGPGQRVVLPPCRQILSDDGLFSYLGGQSIDDPGLCRRVEDLAHRGSEIVGDFVGYIGIDVILGPDADGSADTLIETNPRLTTSYIGVRHAVRENLAQVMLDMAEGSGRVTIRRQSHVTFDADGSVAVSAMRRPACGGQSYGR